MTFVRPVPTPARIPAGLRPVRRAIGVALLLVCALAPLARAQAVRSDLVITNGQVNAELIQNGKLYLGGSFTNLGPRTGAGVPVDTTLGAIVPGFPAVTGVVSAVVSDSAGGWFVGGTFTSVGGQPRTNLAHVLADFSVDSWNPAPNQQVLALAYRAGVVYAGGDFATIGGQSRARIAELDAVTGLATAWNPGANGTVRALAATDTVVYAGGSFTTAGGQLRARLAAIDRPTGIVTPWNPGSNGTVFALDAGGGVVYAGGFFSVVGGQSRVDLAAVDAATGSTTAWNPKPDNQVFAVHLKGDRLYVGGVFAKFGLATFRGRIAAIEVATGNPVATWNPIANSSVLALWSSGPVVYAGGDFTTMGTQARTFAAAIDSATGGVTAWNPSAYGSVLALAPGAGTVYVGGNFNGLGGAVRQNLAQVDLASGALTSWTSDTNGQVFALAARGTTILVGGQYTTIAGQSRNNLAAIDAATGAPTGWNPNAGGMVSALALKGETVYAGGLFSSLGGQPRSNLGAVDATTGLATSFNPGVDGQIFSIAPGNGVVYFAGQYFDVGGFPRHQLAAVDDALGVPTAWDPNPNGTVRSIVLNCGALYAGGFFTTIGGQARNRLAVLDPATALATAWNPNADGPVLTIALTGGALYASGPFSSIGGQTRARLAAVNPVTASPTSWNPGADNIVRAFALDSGTLYAGGGFAHLGGQTVSNLAGVAADTSLSCPLITVGPATPSAGRAGVPYAQSVTASGGSAPYCYAVTAGALPPGLALDPSSGQIAGTPSTSGAYSFDVTATAVNGCQGVVSCTLTILPACPTIALVPPTLAPAHLATPYAVALATTAGTPPFTFTLSAGALPAGLTLSPAGLLSGTPLALGLASFTISVSDSSGCGGATAYTLGVFPACTPLALAPLALPDGVVGTPFADTLTVAGGRAPYTWSVASGSLPAGLTLDAATGRVAGTPAVADTFPVVFAVSDSVGCAGTRAYTIAIFATTPTETVAADASGLMITNGAPCVRVPVVYTRTAADSAHGVSVTFQLDTAHLALCTPALPESSIRLGSWTDGAPTPSFAVTSLGGGAYRADLTLAGEPCGLTTGGTLFTIDLAAADGDGSGTIAITSLRLRDCAGGILPVAPGAPAVLPINRAALVVRPVALPGGSVGDAYARTLTTDAGTAPFAWTVTDGTLPDGLALDGGSGVLSGTPTTAQSSYFSVRAVDANGRTGTQSYSLTIFASPPTSLAAANTAGLCITNAHPVAHVPFDFTRTEAAPVRAMSVTFQLDPARVALATPGTPMASIHPGTWLNAFSNTSFFATDHGGGTYTVDIALLGQPCGITTGGQMFTVDVVATGPDGPATIAIVAARARDCVNVAIPVAGGADAALVVDRTGPSVPSDLAATQLAVQGASTQTTGITLTWTAGAPADLYRAPYGTYPLYTDAASPPDSSLAPGAPWVLAATNPSPGYVDQPPVRGVWSYVLVATDACGAIATSNRTRGTLDYFLADASDETTPGTGNDRVRLEDVSTLGGHYGLTGAPAVNPFGYLDVAPTTDATPNGRPLPDHRIDFEDLMIFAASYGLAAGPSAPTPLAALAAVGSAPADGGAERFAVAAPALADAGEEITAVLSLSAGGGLRGFSARLGWNPVVVQPVAVEGRGMIEGQGGIVLSPAPGTIDAALLGARTGGIQGTGEVARVRFRVLQHGEPAITLAAVDARDLANRPVAGIELENDTAAPLATVLLAPAPNPTRGDALVTFTLAHAGPATLAVYAVNGRLVRTLADGIAPAGVHHVTWDGRDAEGRASAAGVYYLRLAADGRVNNRSLVLLR